MAQIIPIYIPTFISDQNYNPNRVLPRLYFFNGMLDCEPYYIESGSLTNIGVIKEQNQFPYFDHYNVVTGSFPSTGSRSLLFLNENPVYGAQPNENLYTEYWSTYIGLLYNPKTRLLNASAIIPLAEYFKMELNDIVEFRSNYYHLRAINDYNLKTGECKIQLLGPIIDDTLSSGVFGCSFTFDSETVTTTTSTTTTAAPTTTTTAGPTTTTTTLTPTTTTTTSTTTTTAAATTTTTSTTTSTTTTTVAPTTTTTTAGTTTTTTSGPTTTTTTEAPQTGSLATGSIIYLAPSGYDSGSATWYDYSGFGNDAIVSGSNLVSQSNGWEFNGTNNYLVLPTLQSFNVNTNYTYQIFFTVDSSGSQTLFSKTGSYLDFPTQRKETIYNPSYSNCECIGDGAFIDKRRQTSQAQNFANCLVTSSVPSTQCYTWVNSGSMDGCFASGYLGQTTGAVAYQNNARLDFETCLAFCSGTTGNYTYDLGLCQSNIYIGKSYDDSVDKFSGTLRAFVFYNRNLTEAEILSNYNYFSSSFST